MKKIIFIIGILSCSYLLFAEDLPGQMTLVDTRLIACASEEGNSKRSCQLQIFSTAQKDALYVLKTQIESKKFNVNYFLKNPDRFPGVVKIPLREFSNDYGESQALTVQASFDIENYKEIHVKIGFENGNSLEKTVFLNNHSKVKFKKNREIATKE